MILYFSGTGNSMFVAKYMGDKLEERYISMKNSESSELYHLELSKNESLGFVFPIYAWGLPKIVVDFIEKLEINNTNNKYIYAVITCGDTIGDGMSQLKSVLHKKNMKLSSGFSVIMPNNYIVLGTVDAKEIIDIKLDECKKTLEDICHSVKERKEDIFKINKGSNPWLLTRVIHPLFEKFAIDPRKFHVDDKCIHCGICQNICKCNNISRGEGPVWGSNCSQCLSCMHYCPTQAIQYGKSTSGKERYHHPEITLKDIMNSE